MIDVQGNHRQGLTFGLVLVQHLLHGPAVEQAGVMGSGWLSVCSLSILVLSSPSPLRMACFNWAAWYQARIPEMLVAAPADP